MRALCWRYAHALPAADRIAGIQHQPLRRTAIAALPTFGFQILQGASLDNAVAGMPHGGRALCERSVYCRVDIEQYLCLSYSISLSVKWLRAAVVCEGALDEIAHEIGIPEAIRLGHGEEMGGGRKRASILADATEALLGAIFMDGGIEPARAFVLRFIPHKVEVALAGGAFKDYKTCITEGSSG